MIGAATVKTDLFVVKIMKTAAVKKRVFFVFIVMTSARIRSTRMKSCHQSHGHRRRRHRHCLCHL
jgi:hypothetical protein